MKPPIIIDTQVWTWCDQQQRYVIVPQPIWPIVVVMVLALAALLIPH